MIKTNWHQFASRAIECLRDGRAGQQAHATLMKAVHNRLVDLKKFGVAEEDLRQQAFANERFTQTHLVGIVRARKCMVENELEFRRHHAQRFADRLKGSSRLLAFSTLMGWQHPTWMFKNYTASIWNWIENLVTETELGGYVSMTFTDEDFTRLHLKDHADLAKLMEEFCIAVCEVTAELIPTKENDRVVSTEVRFRSKIHTTPKEPRKDTSLLPINMEENPFARK